MLAAGFGQRLRPLTSFIPKPLLPIRGIPVAERTLRALENVGCEAVAMNLHHHGEMIRERLGKSFGGMTLEYSLEQQILGTLGALTPLRDFFNGCDPLIVVNGDSLCHWPLGKLLRLHQDSGADATVLVSKRIPPESFGGGIAVQADGRVVSFRPRPETQGARRVFLGAHILTGKLLERVPEGRAEFVEDLYEPLLAEGATVMALETARAWHDLGTPQRYLHADLSWGLRRRWIARTAKIRPTARIERSIVENGACAMPWSAVRRSVVLSDARIGRGSRVVDSVIGPGVDLPPQTSVRRRLVTAVRADAPASANASIVGNLSFLPI